MRGGWSEKIIGLRKKILIQEFLKKYDLAELDNRRQISDEEKIQAFSKHQKCEKCKKPFKDYREPEYHHREHYADGGKTEIDNIMVLCSECHKQIHGKEDLQLPTEEDIEEEE